MWSLHPSKQGVYVSWHCIQIFLQNFPYTPSVSDIPTLGDLYNHIIFCNSHTWRKYDIREDSLKKNGSLI